MSRSAELIAAVKASDAAWKEWQEDENRVNADQRLYDSVTDLLVEFDNGDIPSDCRVLEIYVSRLRSEFLVFDKRENHADPNFHMDFLTAREAMVTSLEATEAPPAKKLLPIQHFREVEKCSDSQIAAIYDFTDRNGYTLPALVQMELDNPGSITKTPGAVDGRDWVNPLGEEWNPEPPTVEGEPAKKGKKTK